MNDTSESPMRWLYHLRLTTTSRSWPYAPASLAIEGFIHASHRDAVRESATLYFPKGAQLEVLAIDPRKLTVGIDIASTPRGPMPHVLGPIDEKAVARIDLLSDFGSHTSPDRITPATDALDRIRATAENTLLEPLYEALVACAIECEGAGDAIGATSYAREAEEVRARLARALR